MSNKPFPQTPLLNDEHIKKIMGFTKDFRNSYLILCRDVAKKQRDASDRNRDKQIYNWLTEELAKVPNLPNPNTECNTLNSLISKLMQALKGD